MKKTSPYKNGKVLGKFRIASGRGQAGRLRLELGLASAAHGTETLLELVDTTLGIHKLLLACEERV